MTAQDVKDTGNGVQSSSTAHAVRAPHLKNSKTATPHSENNVLFQAGQDAKDLGAHATTAS